MSTPTWVPTDLTDPTDLLHVEFCGETTELAPGQQLSIGRDADLSVDENPFLHRRLVLLTHEVGFWWVANVGSRLPVTVSGEAGSLHAFVPPGSRIPVALPTLSILFTAGDTTYEVGLRCDVPAFEASTPEPVPGDSTLGVVPLTTTQFRLLLALSENVLRRIGTGATDVPSNVAAADRLGWPLTTFNRKLDNVCDKYDRAGVKGLRGARDGLATNRRSRLVEYVVAARIVRPEHLPLLDVADDETEIPT